MTTVLCVAAHPDDEILGCGGTLAKHVIAGDAVHIVFMADGETSRQGAAIADIVRRQQQSIAAARELGIDEKRLTHIGYQDQRMDKAAFLDIVQALEQATALIKPEIIYTHYAHDLNEDHRITCRAVQTAFRPHHLCSVKALYSFETPSSTEWAFGDYPFSPNWFEDISGVPIDRKFHALNAYRSEMRAWPHPRSALGVQTLASLRGSRVGFQAAEAFKLLWRRG